MIIRELALGRRLGERAAALARRHEVRADVAERRQVPSSSASGDEAAETAPRDVLEEHALDRLARAELEHLLDASARRESSLRKSSYRVRAMPIHVRAEPGDYAEAVLLPGDPLRAKYIAETYLDDVVQRNAERGLLGYTGTYNGKPVSVQGTGMGCPGATIVFEELIQLGCKKLIRVGTCGGLQPHHALGDLIVALTRRARRLDGDAPRRQRAALPDRLVERHPRRRAHREGDRPGAPRRADRLERPLLQPGRGPVRALVEARRARGRDGGRGAVHGRRRSAASSPAAC